MLDTCVDEVAVTVVQETTSTNDLARDWLGDRENRLSRSRVAAFVSEQQTAARARRGRSWSSAPGQAVLLSIALATAQTTSPTNVPAAAGMRTPWEQWPLFAAIAARRAVQDVATAAGVAIDVRLKWPNDLLLRGRKLGGILCERSHSGLVVGVGVNVHGDVASTAPELAERATSLALEGVHAPRNAVIAALIRRTCELFVQTQQGLRFSDLRSEYLEASSTVGQHIVVVQGHRTLAGRAHSVDEHGTLWLETADGEAIAIAAGEVIEGSRAEA